MRFFPGNLGRPRYLATLRTYRYLERVTKPPEDLQANPEAQRAVVNFLFADKLGIIGVLCLTYFCAFPPSGIDIPPMMCQSFPSRV